MKYWIKYVCVLLILFINGSVFSQRTKQGKSGLLVPNLRKFDQKKLHFGFILGYNNSRFRMSEKLGYPNSFNDTIYSVYAKPQPGFNLGLVADYHITPLLNLRFVPELAFEDRAMVYEYKSEESITKVVSSTFIHFPLLLKFRAKRMHNFAPYIIGGGQYSIDASSNQNKDNEGKGPDETDIIMKRNMYSFLGGIGGDFFMPYFKFGIELKMNFGVQNVLIQDNTMFAEPIDWLKTQGFMVTLTFEG